MRNLFSQLWNDDNGVVGLEYLILATILGLGLIVGITTVTSALNAEYVELANAISSLSQEYSSDGFSTCVAFKEGSATTDTPYTAGYTTPSVSPTDINVTYCD